MKACLGIKFLNPAGYRKNLTKKCGIAQSERGAAVSEDSLPDGSPRPAEERHLSQNTLTAYRKRFILLLITKTLATAVLSLGLGGRRAAKLAWHRLANANLRRRDGHAPRRHRIVAGDGVKVMRLLLPAIVDRVQRLSREYLEIRNRQMHAKAFMAETSAAAARGELIAKDLVAAQAAYLLVAMRQKILNLPSTYARRIVGLKDVNAAKTTYCVMNDVAVGPAPDSW